MTKAKKPLFSFSASGSLGKAISFVKRKTITVIVKKPIPADAKSSLQLSWRHMYLKAVSLWNALSAEERQEWDSLAIRKHMSGMNWFISQALKPNPGLYLPLQGGTMLGEIDMNSHSIIGLPAPVNPNDATRKVYVDDEITAAPFLPLAGGSLSGDVFFTAGLGLGSSELTLDTNGHVFPTRSFHRIDTFENAATDDLLVLDGLSAGDLILLRSAHSDRTVVVKHNPANPGIRLDGALDFSLDSAMDSILLRKHSTSRGWVEISRSNNA